MSISGLPPLPVTVRLATHHDIADLVPLYIGFMLHEAVRPPAADDLAGRLERLLAADTDEVLLARAPDGAALGYLQQRYYWSVWRPERDAYIEDLFVVEEARGRRIGERLLDAAFERARQRGATRIMLDTNEHNLRGRRLYERLGFENRVPSWQDGRQLSYGRAL